MAIARADGHIMPIALPHTLSYRSAMIANPKARTFFEFVTTNQLSLNKIAQSAAISHGTLRAFRDTEGRALNRHTRVAVARALNQITGIAINIVRMFGEPEDSDLQWTINSTENQFLMNILLKKNVTALEVSQKAQVDINVIQALLRDEKISSEDAKKISSYLGVSQEEIGIQSPEEAVRRFNSDANQQVDLLKNLPIRRVLIARLQHGNDKHKRSALSCSVNNNFHELIISEEIIGTTARPPSLMKSDDAYALYAPDSQMWPRIEEGDLVYIDPNWPAKPNDDAIVYIHGEQHGTAFLAHLVGRDANEFVFSCYTADGIWPINKSAVAAIHKILRGQELITR